jgi:hypothetical protein
MGTPLPLGSPPDGNPAFRHRSTCERHVGGPFVPLFTDIGARPSSRGSADAMYRAAEAMALVVRPYSSG